MERTDLAADVARLTWYHTLELPGGIVTPGYFDLRNVVDKSGLPASLAGKRCLDVGTADGFWAYELERRGAAEVIAVDVDDAARRDWPVADKPKGPMPVDASRLAAFTLARDALGSKVERVDISVYDLSPDAIGTFDFAFIGSLLLHLRDPVLALSRIRSVLNGELVSADSISVTLSILRRRTPAAVLKGRGQPLWWIPNIAGHKRMVVAGGYEIIASGGPYRIPFGKGLPVGTGGGVSLWRRRRRQWLGAPSAWVRARPL